MDSVHRITEINLENLNPPTRKLSCFSSYFPRRIHLDSSSYRSLVRIFSHCVDHSLVPPWPEPDRTLSVKEAISSHGRGDHQNEGAGANTDGGTSVNRQEGNSRAGDGEQGVSAAGAELAGLYLSDFVEKKIEACVNREELHSATRECGRLIDPPNKERSGQSHEGNGQAVHEETVHNELGIARDLVNGAEERVSHLGEFLEVAKGDGRVSNSLNEVETARKIAVDAGDLVCSEPVDGIDYEKVILVDMQDEHSEEKAEEKEQQTGVYFTSLVDYSGLRNFKDDQVRPLTHQFDGAEVEEGEISGDVQGLEDLVDSRNNEKVPEDLRKEGQSRDDFNEVAFTTICIHKQEVTEIGASLLDTSEEDSVDKATQKKRKAVEVREKKKSSTLTEERKAKKKIAKKRKRAQKNREQGVKKLKLHTIVKPKEVKYCNFYRMGRCQQGDLCKFSHDTTPLTKSMPCRYFACNSCLNGDECLYDHELSKYPCLNFMSAGSCNRGDRCKFSHKIQTANSFSQLTANKIDLGLTSEQLKLSNQPVWTHASPLNIGKTKETGPLGHKSLKEANQVPKGIRFISFGTVQADFTNKVKERSPVNKSFHTGAYNHQKRDDLLVHGHRSSSTLSLNTFSPKKSMTSGGLLSDVTSNGFAVNDLANGTKGSPVTYTGGTVNHEVSEATKILDEFLFCGAG